MGVGGVYGGRGNVTTRRRWAVGTFRRARRQQLQHTQHNRTRTAVEQLLLLGLSYDDVSSALGDDHRDCCCCYR